MNTGGIIRDLLRCTADCCLIALREDAKKISVPMAKVTINKLKSDYQRILTKEDYTKLEFIRKYKISDQDQLLMRLLHSLSILYYQDDKSDEYWYDIHPTIYRLLDDRKLLMGVK
jgi:hypothetical protein